MSWFEKQLTGLWLKLNRRLLDFEDTPAHRGVVFNFTPDERLKISRKVREYVVARFSDQHVASILLDGKEESLVNLDVCFWINGEMRASVVLAEQLPLKRALELCTTRALHDGRFRMVEEFELKDLRIELTFFGTDWKPVSTKERRTNRIDPTRGLAMVLDGRIAGWYIPAVHNVLVFSSLEHMISSLVIKKGKLSSTDARRAKIFTFSTKGWIEGVKEGVLDLNGPVLALSDIDRATIKKMFEAGLEWLLRQEVSPGMFRPKCQPEVDATRGINWPRLAFASFVLAEIGESLNRKECTEGWQRINNYIKSNITDALFVQPQEKALTALYAGRAALVASKSIDSAREWFLTSEYYCRVEDLNPIGRLQGAMLLAELGGEHLKRAQMIWINAYQEWEIVRNSVQLALYPEIIALGAKLSQKTQDNSFRDKAIMVADWYVKIQNSDGSFPLTLKIDTPYTRGTGKIAEVLAIFSDRYSEEINLAFRYIGTMQYSEDSLYHVMLNRKNNLLGGFRHHAFDRDAWIDGAGHILLAASRFLQTKSANNTSPQR